jgi:acetyltransferase-like isoleucine patch superfamily enzyme
VDFRKIKNVNIRFFILEKYLLILGNLSLYVSQIFNFKKIQILPPFKIWGRIRFLVYGNGFIKIGSNFHAVSDRRRSFFTLFSPCHITVIGNGQVIIGDCVGLNGVTIAARKKIVIGNGTMIAPNVMIIDHDGHIAWPASDRWSKCDDPESIVIGSNVWIGLNSIILKGVVIGDNSIVAAGSVVSSEVPPNCLVAGVPAKVVKTYV